MYRLFLADDEFKVINGMLRSIDWEKLQSEVVGYAQDGEEAMEKINRLQPDIILTDIRMPKKKRAGSDGADGVGISVRIYYIQRIYRV